MLDRLADRLVLCPTTHPLDTEGKRREEIAFAGGTFEAWVQRAGPERPVPDLLILKFPGTGGRAERMSPHPAEAWPEWNVEVWTVNPPGYGGSGGKASLKYAAPVAVAAFRRVARQADGRPVIVTGNSLGCLSALCVAAREAPAGLLLRNPPPLRELIATRHGWWNLGLSRLIANRIPEELCAIDNARRSRSPAVFVVSERDRTVPPVFQQHIIAAYGGPHQELRIPGADHATPIPDEQLPDYGRRLQWLREQSALFHARTQASAAERDSTTEESRR